MSSIPEKEILDYRKRVMTYRIKSFLFMLRHAVQKVQSNQDIVLERNFLANLLPDGTFIKHDAGKKQFTIDEMTETEARVFCKLNALKVFPQFRGAIAYNSIQFIANAYRVDREFLNLALDALIEGAVKYTPFNFLLATDDDLIRLWQAYLRHERNGEVVYAHANIVMILACLILRC